MDQNCQAIVEDYEHPRYRATRQRITVPGSKPCSRKATTQVKHLCFCAQHTKLAREGFIAEDGRVEGRNEIRDYRANMRRRPGAHSAPHRWAREEAPPVEPQTAAGRDIAELMDGWNTIEAATREQFPNASPAEQYEIAKGAMNHALRLDK